MFWRCLFLQAAWNRRGMQNLGFAYAIDPALRALYPEPARREEALARHLGFFNSHPYMAAAIVGGAIHHEERVAAGAEPRRGAARLQGDAAGAARGGRATASSGPRSARSSAPWRRSGRCSSAGPAVVAALVVYNAIHLSLRVGLFRAGYRQGDALVGTIARLSLPVLADRLRGAGAALCGLAAALYLLRSAALTGLAAAALAAATAALGYARAGARRAPPAHRLRRDPGRGRRGAPPRPPPREQLGMPRHERTFEIINTLGLHARAAAQLVQAANRYRAEIHVEKDGMQVNGKSIMGVLTLAAAKGSRITLSVEGDDAETAMAALAKIIENGFGET